MPPRPSVLLFPSMLPLLADIMALLGLPAVGREAVCDDGGGGGGGGGGGSGGGAAAAADVVPLPAAAAAAVAACAWVACRARTRSAAGSSVVLSVIDSKSVTCGAGTGGARVLGGAGTRRCVGGGGAARPGTGGGPATGAARLDSRSCRCLARRSERFMAGEGLPPASIWPPCSRGSNMVLTAPSPSSSAVSPASARAMDSRWEKELGGRLMSDDSVEAPGRATLAFAGDV